MFEWWKKRRKKRDGEEETHPTSPFTIDDANRYVFMIIDAVPYEKLMQQLRDFVATQDNIFPRINNEDLDAERIRQTALIMSAINNLHERHGAKFMINDEASSIFSHISGELESMNKSEEYGHWAAMARRATSPGKGRADK